MTKPPVRADEETQAAREANLKYVSSSGPGFTRRRSGKGFYYLDTKGGRIADERILSRIKSLVIPPAWTEVWISPWPAGHLQATGYDQKGRKQYIYHPRWRKTRNDTKFDNLLKFGKHLPLIRRQVVRDLRKRELSREKVTAIALTVMEETFMRVGNTYYKNEYGSYGLTTLRDKHIRINGSRITFRFKGKKGVLQEIACTDRRLARLLKKVKDIPGQELFQYFDDEGVARNLESGDINEYLGNCTKHDFTSKDYRTWAGTVHALKAIAACPAFETQAECERNIVQVVDQVAAKLGNTRSICKKYYIYPALLDAYKKKQLTSLLERLEKADSASRNLLKHEERVLLKFLRDH